MARDNKGIFISYRREKNAAHAGWLGDTLSEHFDVFRDIDSIEPGLDFVEAVDHALDSSGVLIAIIGDSWLTMTDAMGRPRLQDPDDYVRQEIATALQHKDVRVIPVLVQEATMPRADELPEDLTALSRRNAFELRDTKWRDDVQSLIAKLEQLVKSEKTENISPSEISGIRIKRTISDFLEFLQQRRIWREGEEYRYIADPEKMRESVEAIRGRLTDTINSLRSENYKKLELLIDIQNGCRALLDVLDLTRRRLKVEPTFGETEFFDAVYPQLGTFQNVVVESCQHLCEDQNLCGESPCRGFC
jgi:hypothetical protein